MNGSKTMASKPFKLSRGVLALATVAAVGLLYAAYATQPVAGRGPDVEQDPDGERQIDQKAITRRLEALEMRVAENARGVARGRSEPSDAPALKTTQPAAFANEAAPVLADMQALRSGDNRAERLRLARKLLTADSLVARREGFRTLLELKPEQALEVLDGLVARVESDPTLARRAAFAIGMLTHVPSSAVDDALRRFSESAPDAVAVPAARVLERRGESGPMSEWIERIGTGLASPSVGLRAAALRELGETRSPAAVSLIASQLEESSDEVRLAAVRALAVIGDESAVPLVGPLLRDKSPAVRDFAVRAMASLRGGYALSRQEAP